MTKIEYIAIPDIPIVSIGDDIAQIIVNNCNESNIQICDGDIIVIAQKIVSISENAIVNLNHVVPSEKAIEISKLSGRSPEECQVFIDESTEILEISGRHVVTRHKNGYVCTSAGVDKSNVSDKKNRLVTLLPKNPDDSAQKIRLAIKKMIGVDIAVIINDTMGKPYRRGAISEAIGIAGIKALEEKESQDLFGNPSKSQVALVDEIAAASAILMGESDEQNPIVLVKGVQYTKVENTSIHDLLK